MNKHILIIPSWYPTEQNKISGSFFREQAQALIRHTHRVGVIYPQFRPLRKIKRLLSGHYGLKIKDDAGLMTLRWHDVVWIPRNKRYLRFAWIHNGLKLFESYRERHGLPDIIHVHSMLPAGMLAKRIKDKYGIPFVVTEHSSRIFNKKIDTQEKKWIADILKQSSANIAVSQAFSKKLHYDFGGNWLSIPNMVWDKFLEYPILIDIPVNKPFTFINVAGMNKTRRKGHLDLVQAFAYEFSEEDNVRLYFVGGGAGFDDIQAYVNHQKLESRIQLLGALPREEVVERIAESDVFVLASHYEPFGVVVIESLALGKPVVATRCGGPDEIVTPANGLLVPIQSPHELGQAMRQIMNNITKYNPYEIREDCAGKYSEQSIVSQLNEVYERVII